MKKIGINAYEDIGTLADHAILVDGLVAVVGDTETVRETLTEKIEIAIRIN